MPHLSVQHPADYADNLSCVRLIGTSGKMGRKKAAIVMRNRLILWSFMARPEGFEPPTPWFVARYSIQLSYGREMKAMNRYTQNLIDHLPLFSAICPLSSHWRRERDSNPRWSYQPHTPLAGERLQPLGHLSRYKSRHPVCIRPKLTHWH